MPPEDRLVERRRLPHGSRVNAVVEEHDKRAAPVPPHRDCSTPASRPLHLVRGEIEGIDLCLGQIMATCHVALWPGLRESRRRVDEILLPSPRNDGTQVFACLVRGASGIRPAVSDRPLVDPIQKLANLFAPEFLDRHSVAPNLPLLESRAVLVPSSARRASGTEILRYGRLESRWQLTSSSAAGSCSNARSSQPVASFYASCFVSRPVRGA